MFELTRGGGTTKSIRLMAENKESAFGTISWYLIAREGDLSARVHPGLRVGEDDSGELSLRRQDGLLELGIHDGRLRVELLSKRHELLVPGEGGRQSLTVSPQTQLSICLPNNLLTVDTNFATDNPFSNVLEVTVVEVPVVGSVAGSARAPRGPATAAARPPAEALSSRDDESVDAPAEPRNEESDQELDEVISAELLEEEKEEEVVSEALDEAPDLDGPFLVLEAQPEKADEDLEAATAGDVSEAELPASVARLQEEHKRVVLEKRSQTTGPFDRLRGGLRDPRRASALFLAAVAAGFLLLFLQSGPETESVPAFEPAASEPEEVVAQTDSGSATAEVIADVEAGPEAAAAPAELEASPASASEPELTELTPSPAARETDTSSAGVTDLSERSGEAETVPAGTIADVEPALDATTSVASEPPSDALAVAVSPDSTALLANVTTLLAGDELPPKATLDFAVQTLKALRAAYPDDPAVRESLETLTVRLSEEARLSFDRGEYIQAGRLIEQASSTGVAQEHVASAVAYLEAPSPPAAEPATAPAELQTAELDVQMASSALPETELPAADVAAALAALNEAQESASTSESTATEGAASAEESASSGADDAAPDDAQPNEIDLFADEAPVPVPRVTAAGADPLAPGPEYTGGDAAAGVAFISTMSGSDSELTAMLDEALGVSTSVPQAEADAATALDAIYPFAQLTAVRVDPPRYPRRALDGVDGSIDLELTVNARGRVENVEVLSGGPSYFERAALRAVRGWRFEPVLRGGEAVPVRTRVRLTFDG